MLAPLVALLLVGAPAATAGDVVVTLDGERFSPATQNYLGVADGQGGWKSDSHRLVAGKPAAVLIQQKEKGLGWNPSGFDPHR
jgi:hypothetical protein